MSHGVDVLTSQPTENIGLTQDIVVTSTIDRQRGVDGGYNYKGVTNGAPGSITRVRSGHESKYYSNGRKMDVKEMKVKSQHTANESRDMGMNEGDKNHRNIVKGKDQEMSPQGNAENNGKKLPDALSTAADDIEPNDSASNVKPRQESQEIMEAKKKEEGLKRLDKENSMLKTVKKESSKADTGASQGGSRARRKMKKGIFVSYSPDAGYVERKFVVETVKQLKENNLAEDMWLDKDEKNTDNPCWFSLRMEAVERCRAAVLFLSDSYFTCPVSVYEGKALLERQKNDASSVKIYLVLFSQGEEMEIPKGYSHLLPDMMDLTKSEHSKKSLAEKSSAVIGSLVVDLEKNASIHAGPPPFVSPDMENTGEYKKKKICQWSANDLQEWLFKLGIKEFYRQSLAENMVDGFLLMSITDQDMVQHLGIDSRAVRKKIMQQILVTLDKEHKLQDNWHLRARTQRARPTTAYLVYDPADVRLAQNLKQDLTRKNIQVIHHQKLGQSKEEFLQLNGPQMATATHVLVVLTDAASSSPFVFHEVLFADWLGKKLFTAMFKNTWRNLRPSMKAVLGDCPAVDFEAKMYHESLDILEHHVKPLRQIPGVVLEQTYINKMAEGQKPLAVLCSGFALGDYTPENKDDKVFISYQWDVQSKVEDIRRILETNNFSCWVDIGPAMSMAGGRQHSSLSNRSQVSHGSSHGSHVSADGNNQDNLQSQIQRNMKAAGVVLCCITPKYMQSDNCVKDLTLAETLHKPIIPLMLRFCPWPPEGAPSQVRKILVKHSPIDLSNEKLFKQNIHTLVDKIKKLNLQK